MTDSTSLLLLRIPLPWELSGPIRNAAAAIVFLLIALLALGLFSIMDRRRNQDRWRDHLPEQLQSDTARDSNDETRPPVSS